MEINDGELLFVYGTLMSSFEGLHASFLRQHAQLLGEASASGRLVKLTWYPGFIKEPGAGKVWGELYRVKDAKRLWPMLDEYEGVGTQSLAGDEYRRELIEVAFEGSQLQAWTYVYTGSAKGEPIPSGRFN